MMKSYNINNYVMVKLTDKGRNIYYHQYDEINKSAGKVMIEPKYPTEDENGYFKDQLWHLIETFGEYIGMCKDKVFETNILIDETLLKELSL